MNERIPAYLYHPEHGAKVFDDEASLEVALDSGWVDSPAKIVLEEQPDESDGLPADIATMDLETLTAYAKAHFPSMVIHPKIRLDTLRGKVAEALEVQAQG